MTTSCLTSYFWEIFSKNIDELCDQHNLINTKGCYEIYKIYNDNYVITIDECSHPQFEEIELKIVLINKNNSEVKYKNTYLLLNNWDSTNLTLPKPINEFIDEVLNNLKEQLG